MSTSEIYISTDVETDGPIPGPHSMLSFESVAFDVHGAELGHFARNLETLPEAQGYPSTMAWWAENQEAWALCRMNLAPPNQAMKYHVAWVQSIPGKPVIVAYPARFDFLFVYWYMLRFADHSPFSHSALDQAQHAQALVSPMPSLPRGAG